MPGVVRTQVGYAGGSIENPTYHNLGGHAETIQIEYDPTQITYEELLDVFWSSHNPVSPAYSSQYRSVVFYHNEEQKRLAMQSRSNQAMRLGTRVFVEIVPAETFHPAEGYHQKYRLRQQSQILQEYQAIYPQIEDFVASTAVARVNGYLGGYGSCERLDEEHLDSLGLSEEGRDRLLTRVCGSSRR